MKLRPRRDADLDGLVAVASRVHEVDGYPTHLPDGDFVQFLTRPDPVAAWVAVDDDQVVGHVALNAETSAPVMPLAADLANERRLIFVARLLVHPDAQRQGIGRMLFERATSVAASFARLPFLDVVDTDSAGAAIALYRRTGWAEVGRVSFELMNAQVDELVFRGPRLGSQH